VIPSVIDTLSQATQDVFETMVFREISCEGQIDAEALRPQANVVGTVGLAGSPNGLVTFYTSFAAARDIASAMLGMPAGDVNGELTDAIGEVTNMIAGSFRTRMAEIGDAWTITIPTVAIGSDFTIKPLVSGRRVLLPFRMEAHQIFVELLLTDADAFPGETRGDE